jgi:hypothetical protein
VDTDGHGGDRPNEHVDTNANRGGVADGNLDADGHA